MMLQIAGGTYLERCQFPEWDEVYGSGLRAAAAVSGLGGSVKFHTFVSDDQDFALRARAHELGIEVSTAHIDHTVSFEYVHGFSVPVIGPPLHLLRSEPLARLTVEGDAVLRFGFIEGEAVVNGDRVVYDPQNPHQPEKFGSNGSVAKCLAVVCNVSEGYVMTGEKSPESIAKSLLTQSGCQVAVIKCGSRGAMVAEGDQVEWVPAFETEFVWPIGSGDVFAAVFAYEWAVKQTAAKTAALIASQSTAFYCENRHLIFPADFPSSFGGKPVSPVRSGTRKAYLAGPFFSIGQIWLVNEARAALRSQGFSVFSPLHDVGRGPASHVYGPDIEGINTCSVVFALVDGLDAGTLFEIGYAKAMGKEVVVFVQNEKPEDLKMLEGSRCLIERDFVTAVYRASWLAR